MFHLTQKKNDISIEEETIGYKKILHFLLNIIYNNNLYKDIVKFKEIQRKKAWDFCYWFHLTDDCSTKVQQLNRG